jgi:hypothetical protein
MVVLTVVVLTVLAHLCRDAYERHVQGRRQRLSALLAEATLLTNESLAAGSTEVTRAELAQIGAKISDSAETLEKALSSAGGNIADAVNTSPGSKLHDMFQQWVAAAKNLTDLGTRLQTTQEVVQQLREMQTALSGLAERIGADTQRMISAFAQEREVTRHATHAHNELATNVRDATASLDAALIGLSERAEDFNEMVLRLTFIVERLDGNDVQATQSGYSG